MVEKPDKIERHYPHMCAGCGKPLRQEDGEHYAKRQVHDIPAVEKVAL